jgi:hypothetical protein
MPPAGDAVGPRPVVHPRSSRRPVALALLGIAAVVVLGGGALGIGILKLPGSPQSGAASPSVEPPPPVDSLATAVHGTLTLGEVAAVKSISLGADGASDTVAAPGESWNGLQIDIPAGSWSGATLKMTAQPITASSFGSLVTPITPLYTVSGAEGMAPEPVTLKIPAAIPDDSFAMGFYYDASGHLEGMPLLDEDATSFTVATQHFSSFFGSLIKKALLPATIDSGFRPGVDDWEFTNWGSSIEGGHCMGMVVTEAWYYLERHLKDGAARLHGLYDNNGGEKTPDLWQDDSDAYRLGGVAQHQMSATWMNTGAGAFLSKAGGAGLDVLQYNAIRYAIEVTSEPQLIFLWDAQGGNAHAILAYRVAPSTVFVADPNYPSGLKFIPFDSDAGKFGTFESGENWRAIQEGRKTTYTRFIYAAKTALVDWSMVAADWASLDAGTVGDDVFPHYVLETVSGQDENGDDVWVPLVDGYRTANPTLMIRLSDPDQSGAVSMDIYFGTSSKPVKTGVLQTWVDLKAGDNPLGIYVAGSKSGLPVGFVDFVRLNVVVEAASQAPTLPASPGAAAGGHWALTSVTNAGGPDASSFDKPGEKRTITSSSGQISTFYNYDGPPHRHEESSSSWGPPPASATPGVVWTTTLSAQASCLGDIDESWAAGLGAAVFWTEEGVTDNKQWDVAATCQKGSASTAVSWVFPAYRGAGDKVEINVNGGDSHGGDGWTYKYDWKP